MFTGIEKKDIIDQLVDEYNELFNLQDDIPEEYFIQRKGEIEEELRSRGCEGLLEIL